MANKETIKPPPEDWEDISIDNYSIFSLDSKCSLWETENHSSFKPIQNEVWEVERDKPLIRLYPSAGTHSNYLDMLSKISNQIETGNKEIICAINETESNIVKEIGILPHVLVKKLSGFFFAVFLISFLLSSLHKINILHPLISSLGLVATIFFFIMGKIGENNYLRKKRIIRDDI